MKISAAMSEPEIIEAVCGLYNLWSEQLTTTQRAVRRHALLIGLPVPVC